MIIQKTCLFCSILSDMNNLLYFYLNSKSSLVKKMSSQYKLLLFPYLLDGIVWTEELKYLTPDDWVITREMLKVKCSRWPFNFLKSPAGARQGGMFKDSSSWIRKYVVSASFIEAYLHTRGERQEWNPR